MIDAVSAVPLASSKTLCSSMPEVHKRNVNKTMKSEKEQSDMERNLKFE